jgi:hypothetical protein
MSIVNGSFDPAQNALNLILNVKQPIAENAANLRAALPGSCLLKTTASFLFSPRTTVTLSIMLGLLSKKPATCLTLCCLS